MMKDLVITLLISLTMKKFNITSEKLATIGFTCIVWLCVLVAAAFALQETGTYIDMLSSIGWLVIAGFFEWIKYKVIQYQHEKECKECKEWQRGTDLTEG